MWWLFKLLTECSRVLHLDIIYSYLFLWLLAYHCLWPGISFMPRRVHFQIYMNCYNYTVYFLIIKKSFAKQQIRETIVICRMYDVESSLEMCHLIIKRNKQDICIRLTSSSCRKDKYLPIQNGCLSVKWFKMMGFYSAWYLRPVNVWLCRCFATYFVRNVLLLCHADLVFFFKEMPVGWRLDFKHYRTDRQTLPLPAMSELW